MRGDRGAAAGELLLHGDIVDGGGGQRRHSVGDEVPVGLEVLRHPADALLDAEVVVLAQLHQAGRHGVEAPVERLDDRLPALRASGQDGLGFGSVRREGLLQQHVLAGLERAQRPGRVQRVGQGVVDGVHVRVGQQGLVAPEGQLDAVPLGERRCPACVAGGHGQHLGRRHLARRCDERKRCDAGGTEDADAQRRCRGPGFHGQTIPDIGGRMRWAE